MKKFLISLIAVIGLSACADDSYLYWMLGDTSEIDAWDTIKISYGESNYLTIEDVPGDPSFSGKALDSDTYDSIAGALIGAGYNVAFFAGVDGLADTGTFVIELWSGSAMVGSSSLDYSAASSYIAAYSGPTIISSSEVWAPDFSAVPEPTSGVLVLIGGALLALRRKRKIVA